MSLLEQASLVITPNAVKAGKLYSVIPADGAGDLDVVRATSATRVNENGLIETVSLNIPRIDYTNGSCPSILVEPQRTNLALRSEEFDNASWDKSNATITANTTISPDGNNNADTYNVVSTGANFIYQSLSLTTGSYSISVYAKKGSSNIIRLFNVSSGTSAAWFDLNLGQVIGTVNGGTASIENSGNGWYRCVYKGTSIASGFTGIGLSDTANSATATIGSSVYIWGAQLEAGSNATSYIPTVASAVTRNADVISKTGISGLIGQTEGTVFVEADIQKRNESDFYIAISNGFSLSESIYLNQPSSGTLNVLFRTGGLTKTIAVLSANWNIGNNKIAIAYNSTLGEVFINGVSKGTVALTAIPTCNQIALASRPDVPGGLIGAGPYKQALLFKTRLSNDELAILTTL